MSDEIDVAAIQAELARLRTEVSKKTAAVEQINQQSVTILKSVEADIKSIEAIDALLEGEEPGNGELPPPGGPDLARGRLFHSDEPITAPVDLAPGQLIGLKAVGMVVKVNVTTGRHRKIVGAASSQSPSQGAFCIGLNQQGALDIWRNGGAFNQIAGPPALLARKASMLEWVAECPAPVVRFSADEELSQQVEVDGKTVRSDLVLPLVPVDGAGAVGAGYWSGQRVDPLAPDGVILAIWMWDRDLSAEEWKLWEQQHDHLVDAEPDPPVEPPVEPPVPPPGDGLEPVNSGALRSDIVVNDQERQTVIGYGWGAGGHEGEINELAKRHEQKLFDGLNCQVIRLHNSQARTFVGAYKGVAQLARQHGCHVLCTGYMYRGKSNPKALADSVRAAIDAGIEITHLATQNEPDGHPDNKPVGNYVDHYRELVGRLPSSVKVIAMEWRHPENGNEEFDRLDNAGLIGEGNIIAGGLHIYNKAPLPALYDQRWMQRGMALWSTETGDMSAPKAAAQFLAGLLHGSAVEIAHLGIGSGSRPAPSTDEREWRRAPVGPADWSDRTRATAGDRHARRHEQRPTRAAWVPTRRG